ncbi:MAG: hypothetical protein ABWZ52_03760 [Acidimicrobiales bacterium]
MKHLQVKLACLALAAASGVVAIAAPAGAAAGPNDGGRNCQGVVLSYFATSDMSPGQMHKDFGVSAQQVQAEADLLCGS